MASLIGTKVGNYQLRRKLGAGGMGEVFEAAHTVIGTRAAVKVLHDYAAKDDQLLKRFEREAAAIAKIRHEGIVDIFDVGTSVDGRPCLIMEYLEGESLAELARAQGAMAAPQVIEWMSQVLDALHAAHSAGVIHRDLKPANIFITRTGRVEILDFGIAKLLAPEDYDGLATEAGTVLGSIPYMAPEQAAGRLVYARTDIFAIGLVLYELITGQRAFEGKSVGSLIAEHLRGVVRPSDRSKQVPVHVERVIMKALAVRPDDRFASVAELATALNTRITAPLQAVAAPEDSNYPETKAEDETAVTSDIGRRSDD